MREFLKRSTCDLAVAVAVAWFVWTTWAALLVTSSVRQQRLQVEAARQIQAAQQQTRSSPAPPPAEPAEGKERP